MTKLVFKYSLMIGIIGVFSFVILKITWMNLTPGYYSTYGCCKYKYMTQEQREKRDKNSQPCPLVVCTLEDSLAYKTDMLFNKLDFNR